MASVLQQEGQEQLIQFEANENHAVSNPEICIREINCSKIAKNGFIQSLAAIPTDIKLNANRQNQQSTILNNLSYDEMQKMREIYFENQAQSETQILILKKQDLELFIEEESCQICNSVEFTEVNHIVFCAV